MNTYQTLQKAKAQGRFPQALFFVGPFYHLLAENALKISQLLLCQKQLDEPCLFCPDCLMVKALEHPDLEWIKPEKSSSPIKIEQIRGLQQSAYLSPQRRDRRIIVIESADKMNRASANALLKILEEPAKHTVFILMAQQLSTVPATILSRCQLFRAASDVDYSANLLELGQHFPKESQEYAMINQAEPIIESLIALIEKKIHPCVLASQWLSFELSPLLWLLYLVYASALNQYYIGNAEGLASKQLARLTSLINPLQIFTQLDKITRELKKLSHTIHSNQTLVLEALLFDLGET